MSLLNEAFENVTMLNKTSVSDGEGGFVTTYTDGAEFKAAITFNNSMNARIGEKSGVTSLYTITTKKSVTLEYHDIFRRESDGKIFRVTSDGDDVFTPNSSSLNIRQVSAEEWNI